MASVTQSPPPPKIIQSITQEKIINALNPIPSFLKCRIEPSKKSKFKKTFKPGYVIGPALYGYMNHSQAYKTDKFFKFAKPLNDFLTSGFHTENISPSKLGDVLKVIGNGPLSQIKEKIFIGLHEKNTEAEVVVGLYKGSGSIIDNDDLDMFKENNSRIFENIFLNPKEKIAKFQFNTPGNASKLSFTQFNQTSTSIKPLYSIKVRLNTNKSERIKNFLLRMLICTNQHKKGQNYINDHSRPRSPYDMPDNKFLTQIEANYYEGEVYREMLALYYFNLLRFYKMEQNNNTIKEHHNLAPPPLFVILRQSYYKEYNFINISKNSKWCVFGYWIGTKEFKITNEVRKNTINSSGTSKDIQKYMKDLSKICSLMDETTDLLSSLYENIENVDNSAWEKIWNSFNNGSTLLSIVHNSATPSTYSYQTSSASVNKLKEQKYEELVKNITRMGYLFNGKKPNEATINSLFNNTAINITSGTDVPTSIFSIDSTSAPSPQKPHFAQDQIDVLLRNMTDSTTGEISILNLFYLCFYLLTLTCLKYKINPKFYEDNNAWKNVLDNFLIKLKEKNTNKKNTIFFNRLSNNLSDILSNINKDTADADAEELKKIINNLSGLIASFYGLKIGELKVKLSQNNKYEKKQNLVLDDIEDNMVFKSLTNNNKPAEWKKCTMFNDRGTPKIDMIFGGDKRASSIIDANIFFISHGFDLFGEKIDYNVIQKRFLSVNPQASRTTLSLRKISNAYKKINIGGGSSVLSYGQYSRYFRKLYKKNPKQAKKELKQLMKLLN